MNLQDGPIFSFSPGILVLAERGLPPLGLSGVDIERAILEITAKPHIAKYRADWDTAFGTVIILRAEGPALVLMGHEFDTGRSRDGEEGLLINP